MNKKQFFLVGIITTMCLGTFLASCDKGEEDTGNGTSLRTPVVRIAQHGSCDVL